MPVGFKRYKYFIPDYSNARVLIEQHRSSKDFEQFIAKLSIEELIALKLEISARLLKGKFYGVNLLRAGPDLIKDALYRYAMSVAASPSHMSQILGVTQANMNRFIKSRFKYLFYLPDDNVEKK